MKTFTFYNKKGGSGKTTLLILFAAYLYYYRGFKVKVIDTQSPEFQFKLFRELDLKNTGRSGSFLSNYLQKRDRQEPYTIETVGNPVNEYSENDIKQLAWRINEEIKQDKYDYLLLDFPALYSKNTLISCLVQNHMLDGIYIPFSTDVQEYSDAFRLGMNFKEISMPCRLLWYRLHESYLKAKSEELDKTDIGLARYGLDVSKVRIKYFNKATKSSDVRCFIRNTLCWPERYAQMYCPELIDLFEEIIAFLGD